MQTIASITGTTRKLTQSRHSQRCAMAVARVWQQLPWTLAIHLISSRHSGRRDRRWRDAPWRSRGLTSRSACLARARRTSSGFGGWPLGVVAGIDGRPTLICSAPVQRPQDRLLTPGGRVRAEPLDTPTVVSFPPDGRPRATRRHPYLQTGTQQPFPARPGGRASGSVRGAGEHTWWPGDYRVQRGPTGQHWRCSS